MGYYVYIRESDFVIPKENLDAAYEAMCALNHDETVNKHGGSYSGGEMTDRWFSWMPANYDATMLTVEEILNALGFDTSYDENGGLRIEGYDSKIGQEELFLTAIKHLVSEDSYIEWVGEDNAFWKWTPRGVFAGEIVYNEGSN